MTAATIFALSSGAGAAGVAVIRMSGPRVRFGLERVLGFIPKFRKATLAAIRDPETDETIDRGIALFFPGPASFTGEDCAELHVHGGRAVVAATLGALGELPGFRLAEAGEFTRRAFENGKMDLTAAEGLRDLVAAETEAQRRQALRQAGGALDTLYEGWREKLLAARALMEAALDFSDEGDVPEGIDSEAEGTLDSLAADIERHLADGRGEAIRDGVEIVLAGPPNVGKSSLINVLAKRDVAIVTEEAGTTRDAIEARLDLRGYMVTIVDTAGLRETEGLVEREGIRRSLERARRADLVLAVEDVSVPTEPGIVPEAAERWRIGNKADLIDSERKRAFESGGVILVSATNGDGIDGLLGRVGDWVAERFGGAEDAILTRARHREGLEACLKDLRAARKPGKAVELRAEDLRRAADGLARVTGRIDVEDVLGRIFSTFCIGK